MALRLSAACRHFSQAVSRQRKWLLEYWLEDKKPLTRKDRKSKPDTQDSSEKEEEGETDKDKEGEPPDDMEKEINDFVNQSKTLAWQSTFLNYVRREMDSADSFLISMYEMDPIDDTGTALI